MTYSSQPLTLLYSYFGSAQCDKSKNNFYLLEYALEKNLEYKLNLSSEDFNYLFQKTIEANIQEDWQTRVLNLSLIRLNQHDIKSEYVEYLLKNANLKEKYDYTSPLYILLNASSPHYSILSAEQKDFLIKSSNLDLAYSVYSPLNFYNTPLYMSLRNHARLQFNSEQLLHLFTHTDFQALNPVDDKNKNPLTIVLDLSEDSKVGLEFEHIDIVAKLYPFLEDDNYLSAGGKSAYEKYIKEKKLRDTIAKEKSEISRHIPALTTMSQKNLNHTNKI